jgi:pimeloyl-ACP methyl ester carboxylesterase
VVNRWSTGGCQRGGLQRIAQHPSLNLVQCRDPISQEGIPAVADRRDLACELGREDHLHLAPPELLDRLGGLRESRTHHLLGLRRTAQRLAKEKLDRGNPRPHIRDTNFNSLFLPAAYSDRPPAAQVDFVRICAHYYANYAWLEDGSLLREADRLAGIPGALLHGRLDMGAPLQTAWELARAWPAAELVVVDDSGHTGSETMRAEIRFALDRFASS